MKCLLHIAAIAVVLTPLVLGVTACGDNSCYEYGSSLPLAAFYLGEKQQTVTGLTIKGIGVPGDSLIADSSSLSEAYLPLRASVTSTAFDVSRWVADGTKMVWIHDTLTFDYQPVEYFHSIECGAMFNFDIKQVRHTTHGIDSVVLLNNLITNAVTPSIRIYFTQ